jgi:hypothetical protein
MNKEILQKYKTMLEERGLSSAEVSSNLESIEYKERLKQFYCRHTFNRVSTTLWNTVSRMKICTKCGLVK